MTARRLTKVERRLRLTSTHEAAHSCACVELRVPFRKVDIIEHSDRFGMIYKRKSQATLPYDHTDTRCIDRVERNIIVDFAGGLAERRFAPRSDWASAMGHDGFEHDYYYDEDGDLVRFTSVRTARGTDLDNIDERLRFLGRHGDAAYRAGLEMRAKDLVRELWPDIQRVARELIKHETLSQADVRRLMNRARR
jgi:hypothetical protein